MRRMIAFALSLICLLGIAGCNEASSTPKIEQTSLPQTNDFAFSYTVTEGSFVRGEQVLLSVGLTNNRSVNYVWFGSQSDFRAQVSLVCVDGDTEYVILPDGSPATLDDAKHEVKPGEMRATDFYFFIPTDAVSGEYNLVCSFDSSTATFENIFTLD